MCGIGAFQLAECEFAKARRLAQALLGELQVRGTHASGIAWHSNTENRTWYQKSNIPGAQLAKSLDQEIGGTCIVHTRWATQGSPSNNLNNHPLDVSGIVGVHNGHISNDNELFSLIPKYKRQGQVDSEAAFAYLMHGSRADGLAQRLAKIRGGAALLWLNTNGPRKLLHAARITSSPLCLARTKAGSVILASTKPILIASCKEAGMEIGDVTELDEGVYLRFEKTELIQLGDIPVPTPPLKVTGRYEPTAGYTRQGKLGAGSQTEFGYQTQLDLFLEELDREATADFERSLRKDK